MAMTEVAKEKRISFGSQRAQPTTAGPWNYGHRSLKQLATLSPYLESWVDEGMWAAAQGAFSFVFIVGPGPQPMDGADWHTVGLSTSVHLSYIISHRHDQRLVSSAIQGPDLSAWQWLVLAITQVPSLLPTSLNFTVYSVHLLSFFQQRNVPWHISGVALPSLLVLMKNISLSPGHFLVYRIKVKYLLLYSYYNGKKCCVSLKTLSASNEKSHTKDKGDVHKWNISIFQKIHSGKSSKSNCIIILSGSSLFPPSYFLPPSLSLSISPQYCLPHS